MTGCKNCNNLNTILRTFEYKCCPKAKYKQSPYISSFKMSLCDYCYEYVMDNTDFPISGIDEYDAWDGLVFPEGLLGETSNNSNNNQQNINLEKKDINEKIEEVINLLNNLKNDENSFNFTYNTTQK
jgi:hypothetical protein